MFLSSQVLETFLKSVILQAKITSHHLPNSHAPESLCLGERWSVEQEVLWRGELQG